MQWITNGIKFTSIFFYIYIFCQFKGLTVLKQIVTHIPGGQKGGSLKQTDSLWSSLIFLEYICWQGTSPETKYFKDWLECVFVNNYANVDKICNIPATKLLVGWLHNSLKSNHLVHQRLPVLLKAPSASSYSFLLSYTYTYIVSTNVKKNDFSLF